VFILKGLLSEDNLQIISDPAIPWENLRNSTVLITGATGLVGGALIRTLQTLNEKYSFNVRILAVTRNSPKSFPATIGIIFYEHDILKPLVIEEDVDYIFHCAAITQSQEMAQNPVGVINTAVTGTNNILALAYEKQVKGMVYISSMEVYGISNGETVYATEDFQGYIDLKNPRSCYPESKRMCEGLCNCWFSQHGVPVKTARLAQTFGAGVSFGDTRVFAQFAKNAISGKDIALHTEGKSQGNYCYISDAVRGLFTILLKGEPGEAYNVANPESSMTVRQMADMIADKIFNGKISVTADIPADVNKLGYAPDSNIILSSEKLGILGWKPKYGLYDMYMRMIGHWRECGMIGHQREYKDLK